MRNAELPLSEKLIDNLKDVHSGASFLECVAILDWICRN